MNEVFLVEDHDEVLKIWQKQNIKGLDLIHFDAHIDFGFYLAKPAEKLIKEAKSVQDLKRRLEYSLNFLHYERDFNKQLNIGNYIYPAIEEGIVNNFYWIVPGGLKEFNKSIKYITNILKGILRHESSNFGRVLHLKRSAFKKGIISTKLLGRNFTICILEKLPVLKQKILLDIDTDFLIIDSVLNADNTKDIGKRKPWITPQDLVKVLKKKINKPQVITVAYSVNGGYTPLLYKHLGDELAYEFSPFKFKRSFEINQQAGRYFALFSSTGKKLYYRKAIKLNPTYRCIDNNYGSLYLALKKFNLAQREFEKILKADPRNPSAILGLGKIALQRRNFKQAKRYFYSAKRFTSLESSVPLQRGFLTGFTKNGLFKSTKRELLFNLAKAEFSLKDFNQAKKFLLGYKAINPLEPQTYYILGCILEKEKKYPQATIYYKDAIRLGYGGIEIMMRLLKISHYLKEKNDIIKYISARYKEFKKGFTRRKKLSLKQDKKIKGLQKLEKKMIILERRLLKEIYEEHGF